MHSKVYYMAMRYYDRGLWNEYRIRTLVENGLLTKKEYEMITGNPF